MPDSWQPHGLQHARLPCPSSIPYSNSCHIIVYSPTIDNPADLQLLFGRLDSLGYRHSPANCSSCKWDTISALTVGCRHSALHPGEVHFDFHRHFSRGLHLDGEKFPPLSLMPTPPQPLPRRLVILLANVHGSANYPRRGGARQGVLGVSVGMLRQSHSLLMHLFGWDGKLDSFSLLPASRRRTPGSSTAGCDEGGRPQCQYQSRCSLPERRVLPCFKESVLCSRANHLLYAELSQCWLAASWKNTDRIIFFSGCPLQYA